MVREKGSKGEKNITIIQLWDWIHVPSTAVVFLHVCLMCRSPLQSQKRSSLKPWRAAFTAGPLTDVGASHADGCTHINTCIRALCQTGSVLSSATPRGKPAMTSPRGECRCRAGTGSESQEDGEADFAVPLTGCGRAQGWRSVSYTSELSWPGPASCGPALYINRLLWSPAAIRFMSLKKADGSGTLFSPRTVTEAILNIFQLRFKG